MTLSTYIRDLLYRYECVIIPDFGGFLTKTISAQIDEKSNTIHPPTKRLGFNSQLIENDGLLANYIVSIDKIPYESALNFIKLEVGKWHEKLVYQNVELEEIGSFSLNKDKNIVFEPNPNINFLTDSFGMTSIVAPTVFRADYMNEEVIFETISDIVDEREIYVNTGLANKGFGTFYKYAATFAILLTVGYFLGRQIIKNNELGKQVAELEKDQEVQLKAQIQEATFEINKTLPAITLNVKTGIEPTVDDQQPNKVKENINTTKESSVIDNDTPKNSLIENETENTTTYKFHIIAGAFREPSNATKLVKQLKAKGYDAHIVGKNKWELTQVAFGSYATKETAQAALNKIRQNNASDAWMLVK